MRAVRVRPNDTLFLRDGRPFNQGEGVAGRADSVFPPTPQTMVGALRATLARELGWSGGPWSSHIIDQLGDGDDLGRLSFQGPHLLRDDGKSVELLLPAPLHLLAERTSGARSVARMLPSAEAVDTDIGLVRLPQPERHVAGAAPLEGAYLTASSYGSVLAGDVSDLTIRHSGELWGQEPRVGIVRDPLRRTTGDDALYQTLHVRLGSDVSLLEFVAGLPEQLTLPSRHVALGGEGRAAWIEPLSRPPGLPPAPALITDGDRLRYTASLITPGRFSGDGWASAGGTIPGLPGHVVTACVGKPTRIGGWDGVNRRPKPLRSYLPAGSTFFLEASATHVETLTRLHGSNVGELSAWGFGQILIGTWRHP